MSECKHEFKNKDKKFVNLVCKHCHFTSYELKLEQRVSELEEKLEISDFKLNKSLNLLFELNRGNCQQCEMCGKYNASIDGHASDCDIGIFMKAMKKF